jgi:glyoxylase-like metal-dependent hydrolase (beta-lactamase superfamily II)
MRRLSIVLAAVIATPAAAQQDFSKVEVKVERVAPGVAVLFGAGGNIGLSYGEDGNVLIDDQFAPLVPKIEAAVKSVDPDPVRFVINTHWHGDHTGGNEAFGKAGAVIVAHDNVRRRMSVDTFSKRFNSAIKASPRARFRWSPSRRASASTSTATVSRSSMSKMRIPTATAWSTGRTPTSCTWATPSSTR